MVSNKHDFTDSEPEIEGDGDSIIEAGPSNPRKRQLSEGPAGSSNAGGYSRGGSEEFDQLLGDDDEEGQVDAKPVPPPKKAKKGGKEGNPLKITLRPGINNLINPSSDSKPSSKTKTTRHSDRSSLSPPPPITLKFGLKSAMAEKASYSSSEDDDPLPIPPPNPPSKKKKSSTPSSTSKSSAKNQASGATAAGGTPTGPSAHKKSYDWLAPSVAGASHRGPPEREKEKEKEKERERQGSNGKITGWSPADEAIGGLLDDSPDTAAEKKPKKSHKKRPADAPPGPGKAWRKGVKKSMANSVKAEDGLSTPGRSPFVHAAKPISREVSPEPIELPPRMTVERPMVPLNVPAPRAPSPPFVLADAKELGFPVFPNPIHAPKIPLGAFPKVTQYFAPLNGGDVGPFPRREPVRSWTQGEKVIVGIGGGQLKIKSWAMGPPSELSRLVQADKEAKELARLAKIKSNATNANTPVPTQGATTPTVEERPGLNTANSFDASTSINVTPILAPTDPIKGEKGEETMSEIADLDEMQLQSGQNTPPIPVPVAQTTPTPKIKVKAPGGGGGSKSKKGAAPRKSNLRQEILPLSGEGEGQGEGEGNDELAMAITAGENEN